jgi:hypothetical protein
MDPSYRSSSRSSQSRGKAVTFQRAKSASTSSISTVVLKDPSNQVIVNKVDSAAKSDNSDEHKVANKVALGVGYIREILHHTSAEDRQKIIRGAVLELVAPESPEMIAASENLVSSQAQTVHPTQEKKLSNKSKSVPTLELPTLDLKRK